MSTPTCEKPFFTWDEDNGYMRFATEAEALGYANETLSYCRKDAQHDGEWPDATEDIRVGRVTHAPVATEPDDMGGVDFTLRPIAAPEPTEAQLVAGLKECEPLGELVDWREGFGRDEMRRVWAAMHAAA